LSLQAGIFAQSSTVLVTTLAGSGSDGAADGAGTAAEFNSPRGVAIDSGGNVFVADRFNHKIRKITSDGVVTTFAGSGSIGSADGMGTMASFSYPSGVAIDSIGNLYVADRSNHKIRKITSTGVVTTLAGSGVQGSADGAGVASSFRTPLGVAVDSAGNVFVADSGNHKIRKITSTGVVSTLAGSGSIGSADGMGAMGSFRYPNSVAIDSNGNVYVADRSNHKIRKITSTGVVSTIAGDGSIGAVDGAGLAASFSFPEGIAVDSNGNIYVADSENDKIRKITSTGLVTTLAGFEEGGSADGTGTAASFNLPTGVAVDGSGVVYVADLINSRP
jgi:sugar lactone lactonase YvrE